VGAKALAVNLSDLAAMGADPRGALLSLALPPRTRLADFDALVAGWLSVAQVHRVALLGGNITRTAGPLVVDVTVTGAVRRRRVLTRAGARAGDVLFVSGTIGAAAAGLAWLRAAGDAPPAVPEHLVPAVARYRQPQPRVRLGQRLGRSQLASACMDLSDGLADAVRQLTEASGTGAAIEAESLPIDPAARHVWPDDREAVGRALGGGDDYELLFAVPARRARRLEGREPLGVPVTRIGTLTPGRRLLLTRKGEEWPWPEGFEHFGDNG
jgi:thiamine-monophosphate kinase